MESEYETVTVKKTGEAETQTDMESESETMTVKNTEEVETQTDMESESDTEEVKEPKRKTQQSVVEKRGAGPKSDEAREHANENESERKSEHESEEARGVRESEKARGARTRERAKARESESEEVMKRESEISGVPRRRKEWWRKAWWIRTDHGPNLRTAKDRRRVWRAATRAAEEIRSEEWTEEVQRSSNDERSAERIC